MPDVGWFNAAVAKILAALVEHTWATTTSNATAKKYFSTGEEEFNPKIYGFVQCVPDLSPEQCKECVRTLHDQAKIHYMGNSLPWASTYSVWCSLMYSVRPFFGGRAMLQLSPPLPPAVDTPVGTHEPGAGSTLYFGFFFFLEFQLLNLALEVRFRVELWSGLNLVLPLYFTL